MNDYIDSTTKVLLCYSDTFNLYYQILSFICEIIRLINDLIIPFISFKAAQSVDNGRINLVHSFFFFWYKNKSTNRR